MINYKGALGGLFKVFGGGSEECICNNNNCSPEFEITISISMNNQDCEELYEPITFE